MQTIGERLEDARKKKGISIREAAEAIKVRGDYLQRFEGNHFDIGLNEIYARGFLRNYAAYLKLPADRIMSDYASLGHAEERPRQPSREVYGRMDLSGTAGEDRDEKESPLPEAPAPGKPRQQPYIPRSSGGVPGQPFLGQAAIYKGGIIVLGAAAVLLLIWLVKSLSSGSASESSRAAPAPAAAVAPAAAGNSTVAISALDNVRIKVVRQSDGAELFQGTLAAGERREFPNTPLRVTATALESIRIEYKGARYSVSKSGYGQTAFDFSGK
jgi:cytoskeleton protein RodZ